MDVPAAPSDVVALVDFMHGEDMKSIVVMATLCMVLATTVQASAQAGPGCHRLMNQAACVACVKRNLPESYDPRPQGSPGWCARMIAERRAQGLGPEPLRWDKKR